MHKQRGCMGLKVGNRSSIFLVNPFSMPTPPPTPQRKIENQKSLQTKKKNGGGVGGGLKIDTLYKYFSVVIYYKDSNILVSGRPRAVAS